MEKVFAFEREINEGVEDFTNRLNKWANLHQEIKIFGYDYMALIMLERCKQ